MKRQILLPPCSKPCAPKLVFFDQAGQSAFELSGILLEFYGHTCALPTYLRQPFIITFLVEDVQKAMQAAFSQKAIVLFCDSDGIHGVKACHMQLKSGLVIGFLPKAKKVRIK